MKYFEDSLILKALPVKRAAYSDRTAWLMAELSRLVYETLPGENSLQRKIEKVYTLVEEKKDKKDVETLIKEAIELNEEDSKIEKILQKAQFSFLSTFNEKGTQAMLVKLNKTEEFDGMLVLVFRGTEPTSLEDIKTDIKANLVPSGKGGRIHKGFKESFELIEKRLEEELAKYESEKLPLYITGHSLGGALALVAAKYMCSDSTGAVYTFGGPRVGDDEFFENLKTPVYRVVNQADAVP
jgi:predicted lipase